MKNLLYMLAAILLQHYATANAPGVSVGGDANFGTPSTTLLTTGSSGYVYRTCNFDTSITFGGVTHSCPK